jgi:hypothetical protein
MPTPWGFPSSSTIKQFSFSQEVGGVHYIYFFVPELYLGETVFWMKHHSLFLVKAEEKEVGLK